MKRTLIALCCAAALLGCNDAQQLAAQTAEPQQADTRISEDQRLEDIVERYFDEQLKASPLMATYLGLSQYQALFDHPLSKELDDQHLALEQQFLTQMKNLDASKLSTQQRLSYEIFIQDRELAIAGAQFPKRLLPLDQMDGMHNVLPALGSGESAQPFNTEQDYQDFISRAQGFVVWLDSAITAMREGMKTDVTLPKVLAQAMLPQVQTHLVSTAEKSIFWQPLLNLPKSLDDSQQAALRSQYRSLIEQQLIPAYQRLADFLEKEYIPAARDSVGLSSLPNGKQWYQWCIKQHTTLDLSAEEIHQRGLAEVSRILGEMTKVKQQVGFAGDLPAFFEHLRNDPQFYFSSEQEIIAAYTEVKHNIEQRLPQLFDIKPKADYEVKAVEAFRAASAPGASYQGPSADGSKPGVFYINTYNLQAQPKFILETLSIHEAAPGHHFQIALQQEVSGLPRFRRFGGYTAFAEGWALYAESLGKELGLFTDPYQWYGRLSDEQLRAMRLVVDTGLHALGWTRQQAIDYMLANSSMAKTDVVAEVERYIAWPGQALSYKLGEHKIRELRNYAQQQLGDKFDVKAFHRQILIDGALPLAVLDAKIKRWVAEQ